MVVSAGTSGTPLGDQLRKAARDARRAHERGITRQVRGAVTSTVEQHLPGMLAASAAAHVPSGYRAALAPLRVRTTTTLAAVRGVGVRVTVWSDGQTAHRDVAARNAGSLRKPVFGRHRRLKDGTVMTNPWVEQRIPPGMVDRPTIAVRPTLVRRIDGAIADVAAGWNRGG